MSRPWGSCIEVKTNFIPKLKGELERGRKGVFGVGTVTDPYQPVEKKHELTRGSLVLLKKAEVGASVLTKSDLVLRDLDILAGWGKVEVGVSVGTVDDRLASIVEPNAPTPTNRFEIMRALVDSGISTYLMAAPIVKRVGDSASSLSELVERAAGAGVKQLMWDKYNPKPIAGSRLRAALSRVGIEYEAHSNAEASGIRSILSEKCRRAGIELIDAF